MDATLVLTTVNIPYLLREYAENFAEYGRFDVGFIVIGDIPTPHQKARKIIEEIKEQGFEADYYDIPSQKRWLKKFPNLSKIIPYRTDNRRNVGFLIAAEKNAQTIVTIDDDNYVTNEDYYKYHDIVGKTVTLQTVSSSNGWFNPCTLLETNHGALIYPRGYPFFKRYNEKYSYKLTTGNVVLNMGLWINDPDVDAVTHLANPTKIIRMKEKIDHIMLAPNTYSPINTQNTAFHRKILPCYYYILMGANIKGLKIDRYGDIWSGLFAKKVIDKMDDRITIGKPLTNHKRNTHNYLKDLKHELWGMILTEKLVEWLEQLQLESNNYFDAYLEIAQALQKFKENFQEAAIRKYFEKISYAMNIWIETCQKIL
jgi:hypothetical protein